VDQPEMERLIKNIDARLARVEQKPPTLATTDDLRAFATKEDLQAHPTRVELEAILATLATKDDLREEGERTRRRFDIVAERMRDDVRLSLEAGASRRKK
jgi:uncharacterized protein YicC (UPF0701 family)